jgi:NAD(P)-dependent dehydrogenase (short-subunit alcohol dehydrogenase family)
VNANAGLYVKGEADLDRLPKGENFNRFKTYMHSKLCNVLFTLELARRLEGTGVTVNALHPGVIRTQLGDTKGAIGLLLKVVKRFWATPEDGAKPIVRLAIDPALEGVSGKYFNEFEEIPIAPNAQDPELAFNLWHLSARLTGCGE